MSRSGSFIHRPLLKSSRLSRSRKGRIFSFAGNPTVLKEERSRLQTPEICHNLQYRGNNFSRQLARTPPLRNPYNLVM
ncbi:hypothetical protein SUGI_1118880 [Cryptomeria japonica]|nr:hypothetical protein SUGI_1118880 [Cryptomeria japonica]